MYAGAAINFGLLILLNALAFVSAFFFPPVFSVFLVYISLPCLCYHIFNAAGFDGGRYNGVFNVIVGLFSLQIFLYAVIYWKTGLVSGSQQVNVTLWDALYFSITTWTTTGYGDFSPPPPVRLISSSESLLGIYSMGLFIAIVTNWISKRTEDRVRIMEHNRKITDEFEKNNSKTKNRDAKKNS